MLTPNKFIANQSASRAMSFYHELRFSNKNYSLVSYIGRPFSVSYTGDNAISGSFNF